MTGSEAAGASAPDEAGVPGPAWGRRVGSGVAAVAALVAYRELLLFQSERSLPEELEAWFFVPSESIGPVVMGMALWLLYRRLPRLRSLPRAPGSPWLGAALLVLGLGVYLWSTATGAVDLLVPSLMLNALACAWLWKGPAALRGVWLPVAFLAFAMPLPAPLFNEFVYRLQIWTTELSAWLLYLAGVPHLVAGEQIVRSDVTFSVIESCSGLRSMEILTLVAILMVDLFRRHGWHALAVVLAAPPVAFLMNGVRAVLLILNPHSEITAVHNLQGVAILLSGLVLLSLWDGLLEHLLPATPPASVGPPVAAPLAPVRTFAVAGVLVLAAAASLWLPRWELTWPVPMGASERFAVGLGLSQEFDADRMFLGSARFSESFSREFGDPAESPVWLFVGIGNRSDRSRSPISPKSAFPGSGWVVEEQEWVEFAPHGPTARARLLRSGSRRRLVYHWYEGTRGLWAEVLRAWLALDRSPWRAPGEIVVVRVEAPVVGPTDTGGPRAAAKIMSFSQQLRPLLRSLSDQLAGKNSS